MQLAWVWGWARVGIHNGEHRCFVCTCACLWSAPGHRDCFDAHTTRALAAIRHWHATMMSAPKWRALATFFTAKTHSCVWGAAPRGVSSPVAPRRDRSVVPCSSVSTVAKGQVTACDPSRRPLEARPGPDQRGFLGRNQRPSSTRARSGVFGYCCHLVLHGLMCYVSRRSAGPGPYRRVPPHIHTPHTHHPRSQARRRRLHRMCARAPLPALRPELPACQAPRPRPCIVG